MFLGKNIFVGNIIYHDHEYLTYLFRIKNSYRIALNKMTHPCIHYQGPASMAKGNRNNRTILIELEV